jgi:PDZ domain-containing secreted protein
MAHVHAMLERASGDDRDIAHMIDDIVSSWEHGRSAQRVGAVRRIVSGIRNRRVALARVLFSIIVVLLIRALVVSNIGVVLPSQFDISTPGQVTAATNLLPLVDESVDLPSSQRFAVNRIHAVSVSTRQARLLERVRYTVFPDDSVELTPPEEPDSVSNRMQLSIEDFTGPSLTFGAASGADRAGIPVRVDVSRIVLADSEPGSPAARAGLTVGSDVIAVDGRDISISPTTGFDLAPGKRSMVLTLTNRGSTSKVDTVTLRRSDITSTWGIHGVYQGARFAGRQPPEKHDLPIQGSSAGLPTALVAYAANLPEPLCDTPEFVATGSVTFDGSISAVDSVRIKLHTLAAAGIDTFLVPAATAEDQLRAADRLGVTVVRIATLDEAITWLRDHSVPCSASAGSGGKRS